MNLPNNFTFYICGEDEVKFYSNKNITHSITFTHPRHKNGADFSEFKNLKFKKEFEVHDVYDNRYDNKGINLKWPDKELMGEIIEIANLIKKEIKSGEQVNLLTNCAAGVSRSTATTYVILCYLMGEWEERTALALVENKRPIARPNPLMVELADELLNRGYKMVAPLKNKLDLKRGSDQDDSCLLF